MNNWSNKFPNKVGKYWFYGDPWHGSSEGHYQKDFKLKPKLYFVNVKFTMNSFFASPGIGNCMSTKPVNLKTKTEGFWGYWKVVDDIELPEDKLKLFH